MKLLGKASVFGLIGLAAGFGQAAPQDPFLVSTCSIGGMAWKVAATTNVVYVANFNGGLKIVDVKNPRAPVLVGTYQGAGVPARGVAFSGRYVYLSETSFGLSVVDVAAPTAPTRVGRCDTPGTAQGIAVSGNYAYIADSDHGLQVIDISNPADPILVGGVSTADAAWDVTVHGNHALVADGIGGLQLIDISNPSLPTIVGSYDTPGNASGVAVSGDYAYVADSGGGLHVVSIIDPRNPKRVAGVPAISLSEDLALSGKYVCLADYNYGLQLIDIGNPLIPLPVGGYDMPGIARGVTTFDNYAYVANQIHGIAIFRIPGCGACAPEFTLEPVNQLVLPGTNVTLSADAVGAEPLHYQWHFEGVAIPGATGRTYSFANAALTNGHGAFSVLVSNQFGTALSSNAQIFVRIAPVIVTQPTSQTALEGQNATFTCLATGAPPIYYRWIRGVSAVLTNITGIATFTNVQTTVADGIRCNAFNLAGSRNSANVSLIVVPDFDRDGIADSWETHLGFDTNNFSDALLDPDNDGMSSHAEYTAGTDPTNAASVLRLQISRTNGVTLRFHAESSISYSVEFQTNAGAVGWETLTNISAGASGQKTVSDSSAISGSEKYYRIVTPIP